MKFVRVYSVVLVALMIAAPGAFAGALETGDMWADEFSCPFFLPDCVLLVVALCRTWVPLGLCPLVTADESVDWS